jgi:hypothetical protein
MALRYEVCKACISKVSVDPENRTEPGLWRGGRWHRFTDCWKAMGVVACPSAHHDSMPGYSYDEHGDLGEVDKPPPVWCPHAQEHLEAS